uniref:Thioredoxin domain-containing protein n=1 Tax=uncultured Thiotrichaceae bacterium TaxID=298394 RepID=A0A6S6UIQ8_9GAMM|nr:MAG: Unknown protein [uncultured Thiotrichaceae bacterium]
MNRHLLEELAQLVAYAVHNKLANNPDVGDGFNHKYLHTAVKAGAIVALNSLAGGSAKEVYSKFGMASSTLSNNLAIAEELGLPRLLGTSDEQIEAKKNKTKKIVMPLKKVAAKKRRGPRPKAVKVPTGTIKTLDGDTLLELVNSEQTGMIYVSSLNCIPCATMGPQFVQAAKKIKNVGVYKLSVDNNPELLGRLGVRSVPTILVIKHGVVIYRHSGITSAAGIIKLADYVWKIKIEPIMDAICGVGIPNHGELVDAPPKYLNHYNSIGSTL